MKFGGCDKTQEMVENAKRVLEQYGMGGSGALYDSTPSQMSNLDTVEQGIQAGPLGESDPRKRRKKKIKEDLGGAEAGTDAAAFQTYGEDRPSNTISTIKRLVRAKYKRKLL